MGPIEELRLFDERDSWANVFQKIRTDALTQHDYSLKVSRKPEFKNRNRYGDVSPYDYSRVCLLKNNIDYINASLVKYDAAERAYILTQGPLPETSGHFWLMVWEQKSRAILMLNKIIEKGQIKCHQYYPTGDDDDEDEMVFSDVGLKVTFIDELESNSNFSVRTFELQNLETTECVQVMQFHYIAWPDFGVPESPSAFLDFLFAVRRFGVLDDASRPPVIHCSAGIGRSGTFCLADTCLVLIEKEGSINNLRVLDTLMEMRRYRMGLIQTPEQLRFSYLAIVEGASRVRCHDYINLDDEEEAYKVSSENHEYINGRDDQETIENVDPCEEVIYNLKTDSSTASQNNTSTHNNDPILPPPIPPRSVLSLSNKTRLVESSTEDLSAALPTQNQNGCLLKRGNKEERQDNDSGGTQELKKRKHEERVMKTKETVERMKRRQQECENARQQQPTWKFYIIGGLSLAVALAGYAAHKYIYGSS